MSTPFHPTIATRACRLGRDTNLEAVTVKEESHFYLRWSEDAGSLSETVPSGAKLPRGQSKNTRRDFESFEMLVEMTHALIQGIDRDVRGVNVTPAAHQLINF